MAQNYEAIIKAQLQKAVTANIYRATKRGCLAAAHHVQRASMKVVPVDTGNLKKSFKIVDESTPTKIRYRLGYSAEYAIYVHENLTATHAPGKTAKFLSRPLQENRDIIQKIIETEVAKG